MELYDNIGTNYNITRKADSFIVSRLNHYLEHINLPKSKLIDVGCGTGNYTIELALKGLNVTGVDPSEIMLQEARKKCDMVTWLTGSAENLPFSPSTFDAALCTLTIHHWQDLEKGFKNIYSVLKEKGKCLIFTSTKEQMTHYWLNEYFPEMMNKSVAAMPSYQVILNATRTNGFKIIETEKYFIQDDLQDLFLYSGKNKPQLYFNDEIRKGISSFANFSKHNEVQQGLSKLQADLSTNNFDDVKKNYNDTLGDYIFILLSK